MFIYSVRASTIRFFAVIALVITCLVLLLAFGDSNSVYASSSSIDFSGVKTNEDRIAFIGQFGLKVNPELRESEEFRVPENFDRVISGYNEIQKKQGLDLTKYKNKKVTRYTYEVTEYEKYDGEVFVNLIIYKGVIIACDISSADPSGFVSPLVTL